MTLFVLAAFVLVLLLVLTWAGPFLIRAAAPVLMRVPRLAALGLLSLPLLFWAVMSALSLMAAWLLKGPDVLPVPIGDVCQRCLVAANPFGGAPFESLVPVVIFLLLPPAVVFAVLVRGAVHWRDRRRAFAEAARILDRESTVAEVAGRPVGTVPGHELLAFSLPRRYGGVVVSQKLCSILEPSELIAVLEHERAHVLQGHHAIIGVLESFVEPLRFVPLFAEIADSVPLYLEIAADNRARSVAGTPALASALIKIGPQTGADSHLGGAFALSIAGPDRVRQLVAPVEMTSGLLPAFALISVLASFAVLFSSVIGTYASVIATGCVLH